MDRHLDVFFSLLSRSFTPGSGSGSIGVVCLLSHDPSSLRYRSRGKGNLFITSHFTISSPPIGCSVRQSKLQQHQQQQQQQVGEANTKHRNTIDRVDAAVVAVVRQSPHRSFVRPQHDRRQQHDG